MEKCPHCGAATRPGAKFCTSCGTRLEEPAAKLDTSWSDSSGENETLVATPAVFVADATQEADNPTGARDPQELPPDQAESNNDNDAPEDKEDSVRPREDSLAAASEAGASVNDEDLGWGSKWPAAPTTLPGDDSPANRFEEALNSSDPEPAADASDVSNEQTFPERSVWSWGAPADADDSNETESAQTPSGESKEDAPASSWSTPKSTDDKLEEVATESKTILPGTDAAGFSGAGEVDALSGDESISGDHPTWESPIAVSTEAADEAAFAEDSRSRATALIDELRGLIWQIDEDEGATGDTPTIVSKLKRARGATSDFSDLERVIGAVKEHPRDIDALRDLGQQADRLQELLDSHTTLTAVIEDAIRQGTSK